MRQLDAAAEPHEYQIELIELEPVLVAGVRDRIVTGTIYRLFEELRGWLTDHGAGEAGPFLTLAYYNSRYEASTHDAEAAVVLDAMLPGDDRVRVRELPATQAARVMHYGDYQRLRYAHEALGEWIERKGYKRVEPGREIYWRNQAHALTADDFVTEILVPVRKREALPHKEFPPNMRSFQLPGLTLDVQLFDAGPDSLNLQPAYLPEGLVVTRIEHRCYAAVNHHQQIVLFWSWIPGINHIILTQPADAGEPQAPEAHPDDERMRYYLPAAEGHPATLILVDRGASVLLTSAKNALDELLRIAASFPRAEGDGAS